MATVFNGPNGGNGIIFGSPNLGSFDIMNGFDFNNDFFSFGANDQINTGSGLAVVNLNATGAPLSGITDTVNVGGNLNLVYTGDGHVGSTITVQGGTGQNVVQLVNTGPLANNNVLLQGFDNTIIVVDATNVLATGAGRGTVIVGAPGNGDSGLTSVIMAGQHNSLTGGDEDFNINGGQGFDKIIIGNSESAYNGVPGVIGLNTIVEAGPQDGITVGNGNNNITDYGGAASILFTGLVTNLPGGVPPHITEKVTIGGTHNTVVEGATVPVSNRDITATNPGGGDNDSYSFGNGIDTVSDNGNNTTIVMGTPTDGPPGTGDVVTANGTNLILVLGDGNNHVISMGTGDVETLGNGNNSVTLGAGNFDNVTAGNGNNAITSNGNDNTISVGSGNNTVIATGNHDVVTVGPAAGPSGKATITLGTANQPGFDQLTLNGSAVGTTVDSEGTSNTITMTHNANATITDSTSGGNLNLYIDADAGGLYSGKIVMTGFGAAGDVQGIIHFIGFAAAFTIAFAINPPNATPDAVGGGNTIKLPGGGSLDLIADGSNNPAQFSLA